MEAPRGRYLKLLPRFLGPKRIHLPACNDGLPVEIADEVGEVISNLCSLEWKLLNAFYDRKMFGNWYVDLYRADTTIRLVKDRSQYQMTGLPREDLERAGLYRVFENLVAFRLTVTTWAETLGK
jgi:hypothetical protein